MATKEDKEVLAQEAEAEREYQRTKDKDAKTTYVEQKEADPEVTPLHTPEEATTELRGYVYYVQQRIMRGSKSDLDKMPQVLGLIVTVLDEIIGAIPPPPEGGALSARTRDPLDAF